MAKKAASDPVMALHGACKRFALGFPEAQEDHPWGESAIKVRGKVFLFMSGETRTDGKATLGVKLPVSSEMALTLPFCAPMGYGLGRAGWVTVTLDADSLPERALIEGWIDQSYRAVAPKKLADLVVPPCESGAGPRS